MKTIKALIILIILAVIALIAYAYSGLYSVAVGTGHNPVTEWYVEMFRERSIEVRAEDLNVPNDLDSEARIQAGAGHYKEMCAGCHGFPGQPAADVFEPQPPALYNDAPEPAQAFWIVRNGIKMSAMPSHLDHSEEDVWNIVAFLQKLPSLSPEEYQAITASAEHTHADGGGHAHENGEPGAEATEGEDATHPNGTGAADADHSHATPTGPVETVDAFHHALTEGNAEAALALLHDQATIVEGGKVETKQQYAAGHLAQDIAVMEQVAIELLSREKDIGDSQATVTSRSHMTGMFDGGTVNMNISETATLVNTPGGWKITQLTWTSEPAQEATQIQ